MVAMLGDSKNGKRGKRTRGKGMGKNVTHVRSAFPTSPKISLQRDLIIFRMIFNAKMQEGIFIGR